MLFNANITFSICGFLIDIIKMKINIGFKYANRVLNIIFIGVSKKCTHKYNAKKLLEILSKKYTLKGGGSDTFATLIIDVQDKSAFHKTLEQIFNVTK